MCTPTMSLVNVASTFIGGGTNKLSISGTTGCDCKPISRCSEHIYGANCPRCKSHMERHLRLVCLIQVAEVEAVIVETFLDCTYA